MIQVLSRTAEILQELSRKEMCSLEELARATKLNKGTLCNILRSLNELGFVAKSAYGSYCLGNAFYALAQNRCVEKYREAACVVTKDLSQKLGESVVISILHNDKVEIISQSQVQRHLMVNPEIFYSNLSLYHSVSGRILFSFLPPEERTRLFEIYGAPLEQWDGHADWQSLENAVRDIRTDSISIMTNLLEGIKSFAIPLHDRAENVVAALGVTLPIGRLSHEREPILIEAMRDAAQKFFNALININ